MNIAIIVPGGVDRSGEQRVVPALLWLIERLARRHNVLVIALQQERRLSRYELLGAQVVNLGLLSAPWNKAPGLQLAQHTRQLIGVLARHSPKVDVLHALWIGSTGLMTTLAGRLLGIPTVLTVWAGELVWLPEIGYGGQGRWRQRQLINLALRLTTRIAVGSRYIARMLPENHVAHWLPLGVDTTLFDAPVARPSGPPWRLLHVASINRVKDPATLLRALARANAQLHDVHLDWVGEDTLGGAMHGLCAELALMKRVTFHDVQPTKTVIALARRSHLYVQSSLHEGQGVAVLEAAAAGVPTVGTAVGLVAELAPTAAWAVPVADPAALAQGIVHLLSNPTLRNRFGQAAQTWARTYNADWTAAQYESLYCL